MAGIGARWRCLAESYEYVELAEPVINVGKKEGEGRRYQTRGEGTEGKQGESQRSRGTEFKSK